ncbi:prohibitin family protein [Candidatus Uhrbacteria bacterium]|nr:prohibitin family protein [Candidatus Uhrbacteria bacterium]
MTESLDKLMYTFVLEDIVGGLFVHVPPGYVACVFDRGRGVLKKVLTPGLHLKIPFWQKALRFNTQTLEYTISRNFNLENVKALGDAPINAVTLDHKSINIEGTILMRLNADQIPTIWQTIGEDFIPKIIRPTIRSRVRLIASRHDANAIISLERDKIEVEMKQELERIFAARGILVENVLLSEIGQGK